MPTTPEQRDGAEDGGRVDDHPPAAGAHRLRRGRGVFLGVDSHRWVAGRMFTGETADDGFDNHGGWWHSAYFDAPDAPKVRARTMRSAVAAYSELAKTAGVWDGYVFDERAAQAADVHLAARVTLEGVPNMTAGWHNTVWQMPSNSTYLLPAVEAKAALLGYLRLTGSSARLDLGPPGLTLDEAYDIVIDATGPIRFRLGYATYWLSDVGTRSPVPELLYRLDEF
jgi:hypothetical protein